MKIFIACSRLFYNHIPKVQRYLENKDHEITSPHMYDRPLREEEVRAFNREAHAQWKANMMRRNGHTIEPNDAILVLNLEKDGIPYYIGGGTFLEMYVAWDLKKKIFLYNKIPTCNFTDEIHGMQPIVLNGDLEKII